MIDILIRLSDFFKLKIKKDGSNKSDWLFVFFGLIIFSTISLLTITKSSIWYDEAFGAYLINFNFFDIAHYTATDFSPPFYYWILKL